MPDHWTNKKKFATSPKHECLMIQQTVKRPCRIITQCKKKFTKCVKTWMHRVIRQQKIPHPTNSLLKLQNTWIPDDCANRKKKAMPDYWANKKIHHISKNMDTQ